MSLRPYMDKIINLKRFMGCIIGTLRGGARITHPENIEKPVFIIGNGESLNDIDLSKFMDKMEFCCVNFFPIHSDLFEIIKPRYLCVCDPTIFKTIENDSNYMGVNDLRSKLESIDWDFTVITRQGESLDINNKYVKYAYMSQRSYFYDNVGKLSNFLYKHNFATCGMENVIMLALFYFIFAGANRVYISGFEMNQLFSCVINKENHVLYKCKHFYDETYGDRTKSGEFELGNFSDKIIQWGKMYSKFKVLRKYADVRGVKVTNLTINSYVDVFDKKEWNEVSI